MTGTEAQARKDAMADAETLRQIVRAQPLPIDDWDYIAYPDMSALRCGINASLWDRGIYHETAEAIVRDAQDAAHTAFRAVPALRGESK